MLIGYNTNGFAHHRLEDTIEILAEIGYQSVALTLETDLLCPPDQDGVSACVKRASRCLIHCDMQVTIETGARFILDPRRKHQPTLISAASSDRTRRIGFLKAAVDVAAGLGASCVSFWSGTVDDDAPDDLVWHRLIDSIRPLCDYAASREVRLAFEPEPGMFIETMPEFERLFDAVDHPAFGLTLDVGHVHCLNDGVASDHIRRWRERIWNIHIEDMRRGTHEHLMFGTGDMAFKPIIAACEEISYEGPLHVELSRHSHEAVVAARQAFQYLSALLIA